MIAGVREARACEPCEGVRTPSFGRSHRILTAAHPLLRSVRTVRTPPPRSHVRELRR